MTPLRTRATLLGAGMAAAIFGAAGTAEAALPHHGTLHHRSTVHHAALVHKPPARHRASLLMQTAVGKIQHMNAAGRQMTVRNRIYNYRMAHLAKRLKRGELVKVFYKTRNGHRIAYRVLSLKA